MSVTIDPGELFQQFLREQAEAHAEGLGTTIPDGLVLPFEDSPLRPLDARAAWSDAQGVIPLFVGVSAPGLVAVPPDWSGMLLALDPAADVPLGLGNFPQRVRSLMLLLRRKPGSQGPMSAGPELLEWAHGQCEPLARLLAGGVLRAAGELASAETLLSTRVPRSLEALRANELACLLWHQGNHREALTAWEGQPENAAVAFNRGLAYLFLGHHEAARAALDTACAALPETGSWHHLASIYRTLVELA